MSALRTCVLLCASSEQFQNKNVFIKTVSVASSNLQSMFCSAQEGISFIIVHGTVENVVRSLFNIKTRTPNRI